MPARRRRFSAKVKAAIIAAQGGNCALSGVAFQPGDRIEFDHRQPLGLGGADTADNLQAVLHDAHKAKTHTEDIPRMRKADKQRKRWNGTRKKGRPIPPRKFEKPKSKRLWPRRPFGPVQ